MTTAIDAVQAFMSEVQTSMDTLPGALEQAAPSGDFAAVLANVTSLFAPAPGPQGTPASGAGATLSAGASPGGPVESASVVSAAEAYLGVPYLWGGASPQGFDCSGLVQYVYGSLGVALPRTAAEQAGAGEPVESLADAQPGDLVFFPGDDGTVAAPGHVGIYIGGGQMIDAPRTGERVSIQPVGSPCAIRRVLAGPGPAPSSPGAAGGGAVPPGLAGDFLKAAATYGVPVKVLTAVAAVESGFDPGATSPAGAEGLMQLMPETAAGLGVDPLDPAEAIDGAARLLSGYLAQYHSLPVALAAYNAGPAAVAAAGGTVPAIPETTAYVRAVLGRAGEAAA